MYVCMHHVGMYVCVYVCMYLCMCVCQVFYFEPNKDDLVQKCVEQWGRYVARDGPLFIEARPYVWSAAKSDPPAKWWKTYGTSYPELMRLAVAVNSQHVTVGAPERGWKRYKVSCRTSCACMLFVVHACITVATLFPLSFSVTVFNVVVASLSNRRPGPVLSTRSQSKVCSSL